MLYIHQVSLRFCMALGMILWAAPALAQLPTGYLVWTKGKAGDRTSRKIYRMTLPGKSDVVALTSGEDVECQVSPDGKWVAYAKAKLPFSGEDYHNFKMWKVYIVSIHGVGQGRKEIKIDDEGYWPSWGGKDLLYYNKPSGGPKHSGIVKVTLDPYGRVKGRQTVLTTSKAFGGHQEVNECFMAPDASWFAARTRGTTQINGVGAYRVSPPKYFKLARAGAVGCMPYVAPGGKWGFIAGAEHGIRWGHAPGVADRKVDQLLIPAQAGKRCYHPGVSTDGRWVLTGQGTEQDHNAGSYDIYIYALNGDTMKVSGEQLLAGAGFNGWPHVWVGTPSAPPPPSPRVLEFYPDAYTVSPGSKVTLTWTTSEADAVELDSAAVKSDGAQAVQPTATATYSLVAKSSKVKETDTARVVVTVNATPRAVVISALAVEPATVEQGHSATLKWKVENPTTLDLDGQRVAPEGTLQVSPLESTSYVLTARGHQGPVTRTVSLTVTEIDRGLLPDKGGFVCAATGASRLTAGGSLASLVMGVALFLLRRRGRRAPRRR